VEPVPASLTGWFALITVVPLSTIAYCTVPVYIWHTLTTRLKLPRGGIVRCPQGVFGRVPPRSYIMGGGGKAPCSLTI